MRIVGFERSSSRKLTKLVTDHIFGHINRQKIFTIVNGEIQTNKVRCYSRPSGPCFDRFAITCILSFLNLFHKMRINKEAFFYRSSHNTNYLTLRPLRRVMIIELEGLDFLRVGKPFDNWPHGDEGCPPPEVRPSPPPMG
jgi:hypothetical protein